MFNFRTYAFLLSYSKKITKNSRKYGFIWLQFTDHDIEGVVPLELLPPDVRSKYQAKPNDKSKRAKKDESKGAAAQAEENQVSLEISSSALIYCKV